MFLIFPLAICFAICCTFCTSAGATFELIFPRPTPSFARLKTESLPPLNYPASMSLIVAKTDVSTRFIALVSTCGPM